MARISSLSPPAWRLLFLLAVLLTVGCGTGKVRVEGQVTFDGQVVENGSISFEPADGQGAASGGRIDQGAYALTDEAGLTPGRKTVRIRAVRKTGRQIEAGPPFPKGHLIEEEEAYLPAIYNDKSTLTAGIVAGKPNTINFHLKK